jgi:hypothetical protein
MQIGGIAVWQIVGIFGFGTAAGLAVGLLLAKWLYKPDRSDWWGWLIALLLILFVAAVAPIAGIISVTLTFAAHHAGRDGLVPYLAGAGFVFLTLVAGVILRDFWTRSSRRRRRAQETSSRPAS